jgi:mono/diheme cytochrome c family protein
MRMVVAGLAVAVWLVAGTVFAQDAKVQAGMKVYDAQKCSMCHAVAGKGNAKNPLDGVGAKLNEAQIKEWIVAPAEAAKKASSTAKPPMKAYDKLPAADVDALVAYMKSLNKK